MCCLEKVGLVCGNRISGRPAYAWCSVQAVVPMLVGRIFQLTQYPCTQLCSDSVRITNTLSECCSLLYFLLTILHFDEQQLVPSCHFGECIVGIRCFYKQVERLQEYFC